MKPCLFYPGKRDELVLEIQHFGVSMKSCLLCSGKGVLDLGGGLDVVPVSMKSCLLCSGKARPIVRPWGMKTFR